MNAYENWFCGSALWRYVTRRQLLPWLVHGTPLGDHVLELGAGRGAATLEIAKLAQRVTSLEYDRKSVELLSARAGNLNVQAIQGDASALPFADASFSSAIAILMLHHLKSQELQDRAFSEIYRVLRPGCAFIAFEIRDGWFHRVGHFKSTFVPVDSSTAPARLAAAAFSRVTIDIRSGGFCLRAFRVPQS